MADLAIMTHGTPTSIPHLDTEVHGITRGTVPGIAHIMAAIMEWDTTHFIGTITIGADGDIMMATIRIPFMDTEIHIVPMVLAAAVQVVC